MNSPTPPLFACLQSVVTFCYRSVMMDEFYRMTMQDRTEELNLEVTRNMLKGDPFCMFEIFRL